ncbi:MAG: DUF1636 domain-containing protein [Kiloniellales bacterium]|nr:DUF1636 domain-containing protein [Kiloniellales bacterium]
MTPTDAAEVASHARADGPVGVVVDICVACGSTSPGSPDGLRLHDALAAACAGDPSVAVRAVDCLAVCDRPVTLAFRALGRWSYVVGDVPASGAVTDVIAAAKAVSRSPHGVPPMAERPSFFRKGVIGRLPPEPVSLAEGSDKAHA